MHALLRVVSLVTLSTHVYQKNAQVAVLKRMISFGDSLTDNGVDGYLEDSCDSHGFQKYSTGPVWADYLADKLRIGKKNYLNMAYGGALSGYGNLYGYNWSGVLYQVDQFFNKEADNCGLEWISRRFSTLAVIQAGGSNDIMQGQTNPNIIADNLIVAIRVLMELGLRRFLILNIGDASIIPALKNTSKEAKAGLRALTTATNQLIAAKINELRAKNPNELKITVVHIQEIIYDVLSSGKFIDGIFTHKKSDVKPGDVYRYAWFDKVHPTTSIHQIVADEAFKKLQDK